MEIQAIIERAKELECAASRLGERLLVVEEIRQAGGNEGAIDTVGLRYSRDLDKIMAQLETIKFVMEAVNAHAETLKVVPSTDLPTVDDAVIQAIEEVPADISTPAQEKAEAVRTADVKTAREKHNTPIGRAMKELVDKSKDGITPAEILEHLKLPKEPTSYNLLRSVMSFHLKAGTVLKNDRFYKPRMINGQAAQF